MLFHRLVWSTFIALLGTAFLAAPMPPTNITAWDGSASLLAQDIGDAAADETDGEGRSQRPDLELGSSGPLVIELQVKLQRLGLYDGEVDGSFSEATQRAVAAFQREYGLTVSGRVEAETWQALEDPAAAKITAGIQAAQAEAPADTGADAADADAPAQDSTGDSQFAPFAPRSLGRWAIIALAAGGLGWGGWTVGKTLMGPAIAERSRTSKRKKSRSLHSQQRRSGLESNTHTSSKTHTVPFTQEPDTLLVTPDPDPEAAPSSAPLPFPPPPPSLAPSRALQAKPAPAKAIRPSQNVTPLTPTARLPRLDIVQTLIGELQTHDPARRRKAIWELGQRADSRAIQPLVNLMATSDSKQRSLILAALSEIGTQTLKPMKRALAMSLQDENAEVRKNAIRDLTRIYDLVAQISNLLAVAAEDHDPEVRETARWALGQLNRIRANAGLEQATPQQLLKNSVSPPENLSSESMSPQQRSPQEL